MSGINLLGSDLRRANLQESNLQGAYLQRADLRGAYLQRAYLSAANLMVAENLTQGQLNWAIGDEYTKLPEGLHTPSHWTQGED